MVSWELCGIQPAQPYTAALVLALSVLKQKSKYVLHCLSDSERIPFLSARIKEVMHLCRLSFMANYDLKISYNKK